MAFNSLITIFVIAFGVVFVSVSDSKTTKNLKNFMIATESLDGEDVFLKYKCNNCHTVSTAGIKAKTKSKAPDLVDVTVRHKKPWVRRYIRQNDVHVSCLKVDPSRDGKKHALKFKGTQEEEDALIQWLDKQRSGK